MRLLLIHSFSLQDAIIYNVLVVAKSPTITAFQLKALYDDTVRVTSEKVLSHETLANPQWAVESLGEFG